MGRPDKEGSPIQPDGSLLSLLGDLLFAGAIVVMIYPCLRRTVSRLDGHFFRQFFHIFQILLAVAALCFILMLLIGQQMRIAFCSVIRPYVGNTEEDKAYISVVLKILVCFLLLFNYFCASGLQKIVNCLSDRLNPTTSAHERMGNAELTQARYTAFGDALMNNSNTNSQTPVTQTQSIMQSDIFPSMSFPDLSSEACQGPGPTRKRDGRLYRDVGTMVRFSGTELQQCSRCTLHLCPTFSSRPSTAAANTVFTSLPSTITSSFLHSRPQGFSDREARTSTHAEQTSNCLPHQTSGTGRRSVGCGSAPVSEGSSCHIHLDQFWSPSHMPRNLPRVRDRGVGTSGSGHTSRVKEQRGRLEVDSDPPSSFVSSDYTSSGSSSCVSDQSSFLSGLDLVRTSLRDERRPNPPVAFNLGNRFRVDRGCGPTASSSAVHPITMAPTECQHDQRSVWVNSCSYHPVAANSSVQIRQDSALAVTSNTQCPTTCSAASSCPSGTVRSHHHSSSHCDVCVLSRTDNTHHHSCVQMTKCNCHPIPNASCVSNTSRSGRKRRLPPMPKMTRSGKIYGYG